VNKIAEREKAFGKKEFVSNSNIESWCHAQKEHKS
jgi:hypothetical protein